MTWDIEAAKKRCEEAQGFAAGKGLVHTVLHHDLPAAIARIEWQEKMLEKMKVLLQDVPWLDWPKRHAERQLFLRDLEGGPPDDLGH